MEDQVTATTLHPDASDWATEVDRVRAALGAPANVQLFPPHFIKATLPKIGGGVVLFHRAGRLVGSALLFPTQGRGGDRPYTVRLHRVPEAADVETSDFMAALRTLAPGTSYQQYQPDNAHQYRSSVLDDSDGITIRTPDAHDAGAIRALQRTIWHAEEDYLYPVDIHSEAFTPCLSQIAVHDGNPVSFLFGFCKLGGPSIPAPLAAVYGTDVRLESQLLGVLPSHRKHGLGFRMKRIQATIAQEHGFDVVNWTVDPLQYGNALLNFNRLRGVALSFSADYYQFRNALNQVPASRFVISWFVRSRAVQEALASPRGRAPLTLRDLPGHARLNDGPEPLPPPADARCLAIEIPRDWNTIQSEDAELASRWRSTTDALFERVLSSQKGQFAITSVAQDDDRVFLIAERVSPALVEALSPPR